MDALNRTVPAALFLLALLAPVPVVADDGGLEGEPAYIVNDYRYDPAGSDGDIDTGHALCATRCNALSFDFADYLMAGSWELRKIAADREVAVPLDNPFMKGNCLCTVDEYLVKANTRNWTR